MGLGSPTALVGRQDEAARLESLAAALTQGRGSIAVVEGEAGIGKTHLVATLLASLRTPPFRILGGHARELEQSRPFAAIAAALGCSRPTDDPMRAAIAALVFPAVSDSVVSVTDDPGMQFRIVDAIVGLVEEEALVSPVVLIVEDLQWSDPATAMALDAIAHRLRTLPVMLVATLRPLPRSPELSALLTSLDRLGALRLALGPLDQPASVQLAEHVLGNVAGATLVARIGAAGGNPLFLIELVDTLSEQGSVESVNGRAEITDTRLPASLREAVLHRVVGLPDETLHLLRLTAVLGTVVRAELLAAAADNDAAELTRLLGPALRSGVLEDHRDGLRFRHDLVQEAIYDTVPTALRTALHRHVAVRLAQAGAAAPVVAEHFWRGAAPGDDDAIDWLERAAAESAARSPLVAVELFARALALCGEGAPRCNDLKTQQAACLLWTGRVEECTAACRAVLDSEANPHRRAQAACWLGLAMLAQGQMVEAAEVFSRAAESPALDDVESARLLAYAAQARTLLGDLDGAAAAATAARAAAAAVGDAFASCLALAALTFSTYSRGNFQDAVALAEEGVRLADQSPDRIGHRFQMELFRANCLLDVDRIGDCLVAMHRGLRLCAELGTRWNLPVHHTALAAARFVTGEWDDALADCATARELTDETGARFGHAYTLSIEGLIAVHRDDLPRARAVIAAAEQVQRETGLQYRADWTTWARALLLEAEGRPADAHRKLRRTFDAAAAFGFCSELPVLGPDLVRLALTIGDQTAADEVARRVADVADGNEAPWLRGATLRCRGAVDDDIDRLLGAVDIYRSTSRPLDAAIAREEAAAALRRRDRIDEACTLLTEALDLHTALQGGRGIGRVTAALREMGVRIGARGARRRPATGWESLTDTERSVVALVVEGLSNPKIGARLFISPRTVQTHLRHVFAKLGLSTRAELAAEAARRSASAPPHAITRRRPAGR